MNRGKTFFLYDYNLYSQNNMFYKSGCEQVEKIARLCQNLKIPVVVFMLPYRYQYLQIVNDPWIPQQLIGDKWESVDIPTFDARNAFQTEDIDSYFLYGDPMHLSAKGHYQLASFVIQKLKKKVL